LSRGPKHGDFGVDWDADAIRASKAPYPYTEPSFFNYFKDLVKPHDRVLEVGCQIASWIWAWWGIEPTIRYEGIDWSAVALEIAKKRYGPGGTDIGKHFPAKFHHMDAREMNFNEEFDIAFTHTFYQHTNPETKALVVPKVRSALRHGGLHIIQENTSYESGGTWFKEGWIKYFEERGFQCIRTHDIGGGGTGFVFRAL
jgi:hypothetical protein